MVIVHHLTSPNKSIFRDEGEKATFFSCLGITSLRGEGVSITPRLLLFRRLLAPLEVALLETAVGTDRQIVGELREKCNINKGSEGHEYTAGVGLTQVVSPTTS